MNTLYPLRMLSHLRPMLIGFRKIKGLTQKDIAARLGVTQKTYASLEAAPARASLDRLFRVFNVLGIEMALSSNGPSFIVEPECSADLYPHFRRDRRNGSTVAGQILARKWNGSDRLCIQQIQAIQITRLGC